MNSWLSITNIILTGGLVILTGFLAYYTKLLAAESRQTRKQQNAPHIVVNLEPSRYIMFVNIVIENTGRGVAKNVRIEPLGEYKVNRNGKIIDLSAFSLFSISLLKPGQKISSWLCKWNELPFEQAMLRVTFADSSGGQYSSEQSIELTPYKDMSRLGKEPIAEIAEALKKYVQDVGWILRGQHRLKVETFDAADRKAEQAAEAEWIEDTKEMLAKESSLTEKGQ